jgi:hypothetical protein
MAAVRIVMRPVHYRQTSRIVHHFSADVNPVADGYRATRRDRNVIDDFDGAGRRAGVEGFVHRVRSTSKEKVRRGCNGRVEVYAGRPLLRVRAGDIHGELQSRTQCARQEAVRGGAKERAV